MCVYHIGMAIKVDSMSALCAVGRGFALRRGHTKDHHKSGTNCLPPWHKDIKLRIWQCNQTVK